MSKIKKHNNTVSKKIQEPIGTRIAKAVFEEKRFQKEFSDIFLTISTL